MTDITKQYRTRDGREVRIYATDGGGDRPVHGAVINHGGWFLRHWSAKGTAFPDHGHCSDDLIEVKSRPPTSFCSAPSESPPMIDITKTYKTRDGREVRIYTTDCGGDRPVHGAFWSSDNRWSVHSWRSDGRINGKRNLLDLIEVKQRIKRELWVNVYADEDDCVVYSTKVVADNHSRAHSRLACVKIDIDCEEGDGLA